MKLQSIRDLLFAMLAGATAPYALVVALGSLHATLRGSAERISAFMAPGAARFHRVDPASLALDALVGCVVGVVLSLLVARFTRTRCWLMWLAFAAAVLVSLLLHFVLGGSPARWSFIFRQPATLFVLGGAWIGFWLGPRASEERPAR